VLPVDVRFAPPAVTPDRNSGGAARSILSYLPPETVLIRMDASATEADLDRTWAEVLRLYEAERGTGATPEPPEQLFAPPSEAAAEIARFPQIFVGETGSPRNAAKLIFRVSEPEPIDRDMPRLGALLREGGRRGERTLILCDNDGQ